MCACFWVLPSHHQVVGQVLDAGLVCHGQGLGVVRGRAGAGCKTLPSQVRGAFPNSTRLTADNVLILSSAYQPRRDGLSWPVQHAGMRAHPCARVLRATKSTGCTKSTGSHMTIVCWGGVAHDACMLCARTFSMYTCFMFEVSYTLLSTHTIALGCLTSS